MLLKEGGQWKGGEGICRRICSNRRLVRVRPASAGRTGREPCGGHRVAAAMYYDYDYHDYYDYYDDELTWRTPAPQA